jgi:L-fuconolactonase
MSHGVLRDRRVVGLSRRATKDRAARTERKDPTMDIVDAQFHLTPGKTDAMFGAMDALGITSVLLEEYWFDPADRARGVLQPGYPLENGAWRAVFPNAELASILNPERVSFYVRVDRRDPRLESVMRILGDSPFARGYRVLPVWTPDEAQVFAGGGYDEVFAIAEDVGMPICLMIPGWVHQLPRYLARYPDLTFVVDHCGMPQVDVIDGSDLGGRSPLEYFDVVLQVAEHPNVALKWGHVQRLFDEHEYPYAPIRPYLRRAIEAFGADRLLWASDASVIWDHSWSELLTSLRDDPELSQAEKEWILGRTARRIFQWPAPDAQSMAEPESTDSVQPVMISESGPTR